MKYCIHCKAVKPLDDFHVNRFRRDGRQGYCKSCFLEKSTVRTRRSISTTRNKPAPKSTLDGYKICNDCRCEKPIVEFARNCTYRDGYANKCKACTNVYCKFRRSVSPSDKALCNARRRRLKMEMIVAYGGACSCCGENEPDFLSLEHKFRDGKACRERGSANEIATLKRLGWPQDRHTILCFNCNLASGFFGSCPHKRNETLLRSI